MVRPMPPNEALKRYLDQGVEFTQITQKRAEEIVNRLVKQGELRAEQAQGRGAELVDRSRKSSERLAKQIRDEVRSQVQNLGLATQADVVRLERRLAKLEKGSKPAKKTGEEVHQEVLVAPRRRLDAELVRRNLVASHSRHANGSPRAR